MCPRVTCAPTERPTPRTAGTDPFIIELITPRGKDGYITYDQYREWYYGGTFNHTRSINAEALIWSRPVDSYPLILNLSAFLEFSPKCVRGGTRDSGADARCATRADTVSPLRPRRYVMFSGWVGDQDPNFSGLRYAMVNMFESAWQNYTNFGSDTGGYRGGTRTAETLIRWAQVRTSRYRRFIAGTYTRDATLRRCSTYPPPPLCPFPDLGVHAPLRERRRRRPRAVAL